MSIVGQQCPPIRGLTWVKGDPVPVGVANSSGPKRVLVVECWATWCPPCRDSIPVRDLSGTGEALCVFVCVWGGGGGWSCRWKAGRGHVGCQRGGWGGCGGGAGRARKAVLLASVGPCQLATPRYAPHTTRPSALRVPVSAPASPQRHVSLHAAPPPMRPCPPLTHTPACPCHSPPHTHTATAPDGAAAQVPGQARVRVGRHQRAERGGGWGGERGGRSGADAGARARAARLRVRCGCVGACRAWQGQAGAGAGGGRARQGQGQAGAGARAPGFGEGLACVAAGSGHTLSPSGQWRYCDGGRT